MKSFRGLLAALLIGLASPVAAGQTTLVTPGAPLTMTGLASFLNSAFNTIGTQYSGTAAPAVGIGAAPMTYQWWVDTSASPSVLKMYDGTSWIPWGDIDTAAHTLVLRLPTPTTVRLGGALSSAAVSNQFVTGLDTSGALTRAQPSAANLSNGVTGSGLVVLQTSPTLITPALGVSTATSINKVAITAPATGATLTIPDGVTLTGPAASGTAMTLGNAETVTGVKSFASGTVKLNGSSSGSGTLTPPAAASTYVWTLPAATDTLVGKATTDTFTNKTLDTAGTGNSFSINGVAVTANTGTGAMARASGAALTAPAITGGTADALTSLGIRSTGSAFDIKLAATEVLTANRALTFVLGDTARTVTLGGNLTLPGGFATSGAFFVTLAATALTSVTLPTTGTLATLAGAETLTNKSIVATQLTGTLQAGQFPALTGDLTTSAGSLATTLATVNANVGSFGGASSVPSFTVNAKGLITAASAATVIAPAGTLTGTTLNATVVTSSLTTVGTIGTGTWQGSLVGLTYGGTNAALTASNGGIVYSDASKLQILAGTATPNQCLLSQANTAPIWGSCAGGAAVSSVANSNGTLTISPTTGAVVASLNLGNANSWSAIQTYVNSGIRLLGSSTGYSTFASANASATNYTITFPAATGTVALTSGVVTSVTCGTGLTGGAITSTGTCAVDKATGANLRAGTSDKILTADNIFDAEQTITYAASQTFDFSAFLNGRVTLTGNITSLTCSNMKASQSGAITLVQDATGSRTMVAAWCSQFRWSNGARGVLSTAANAIDVLFYQCISTSICYVSLGKAQAN